MPNRYYYHGSIYETAEGVAIAALDKWNWAKLANFLRTQTPGTCVTFDNDHIIVMNGERNVVFTR